MLSVAEMTFRQNVMDAFIIFTVLVQPLIIAVLALWMLRARGQEIAIYVVVGSGLTGLWSSLLFISGNSINVERWSGTLETLVGVPTHLSLVVIGKNLANVLQSLASMVISYLLAAFLFGYSLRIEQPFLFTISLLLTILAFISFALIIAPVFVMNPGVGRFQNAMEFPVYILCGFLFPIALLPGWTTPVSYFLPPYWAARALHLTSSGGGSLQDVLYCWGLLLVFSALYLFISSFLFRAMLDKARRDATLDLE
jgi:ABC-2 type transport system permease protein